MASGVFPGMHNEADWVPDFSTATELRPYPAMDAMQMLSRVSGQKIKDMIHLREGPTNDQGR